MERYEVDEAARWCWLTLWAGGVAWLPHPAPTSDGEQAAALEDLEAAFARRSRMPSPARRRPPAAETGVAATGRRPVPSLLLVIALVVLCSSGVSSIAAAAAAIAGLALAALVDVRSGRSPDRPRRSRSTSDSS